MLSLTETIRIIDEIVAEKGEDYKYTTDPKTAEKREDMKGMESGTNCYYSHVDGTPGCIVGTFVHKLKPDYDLRKAEGMSVGNILHDAEIETNGAPEYFLIDCQKYQDKGFTWAESVLRAKRNEGLL